MPEVRHPIDRPLVKALQFDGVTDMLSRSKAFTNTSIWSMLCFFRVDTDDNTPGIIFGVDSAADNFIVFGNGSDGVTIVVSADTWTPASSTLFVATVGTWYVGALTKNWNGTTGTLIPYFATAGATTITAATSMTNTGALSMNVIEFGNDPFGTTFIGSIAAMKVWDGRVLTQAELEAEMLNISIQDIRNCYYWNNGFAGNGIDTHGQGNDFTEAGTVVTVAGPSAILY